MFPLFLYIENHTLDVWFRKCYTFEQDINTCVKIKLRLSEQLNLTQGGVIYGDK